MKDFLSNSIGGEIMIVYGLIAIVLILIVVILFLDKREKRKKKDLFNNKFINTVKMKPIQDVVEKPAKEVELQPISQIEPKEELIQTETILAPVGTPEWVTSEIPIVDESLLELTEEVSIVEEDIFINNEFNSVISESIDNPIKEIIEESLTEINYSKPLETISKIEKETEEELSKTKAQLQLEELQTMLEKAKEEEIIHKTRYEVLQEEEAIISYNELVKVCDRLYDENEKIQYMDEGNEPINLEELQRKFQREITSPIEETSYEVQTKIEEVIEETPLLDDVTSQEEAHSRFHSTPFISPVYGIQRDEESFYRAIPSSEQELLSTE